VGADNPGSLWTGPAPHAVAWREWDGEIVLYDDATGDTHHLDALGGEVLLTLMAHPHGIAITEIVRDIGDRMDDRYEMRLASQLERAMARLAEVGLARCVSI
jgi:PqqD family protein of HPr-rel-A system